MKRLNLLAWGMALVLFSSCEEEPPFIDYNPPKILFDTTYIDNNIPAPQRKITLLEDISGVKCPNCPDATKIALATKTELQGRLNLVVIHPNISALGSFVDPVTTPFVSKQDFRTDAGKAICEQIIGTPNSLPRGSVDRVKFTDQLAILTDRTIWNAKIKERDALTTPVNLEIKQLPAAANQILIEVSMHYTQAQTDSNYLSVMLLEDSMIDVQEYQTVVDGIITQKFDSAYVHNHVLRDMFTLYTGELLNKSGITLTAGRVIKKRYLYNIPSDRPRFIITKKHTKILAFVHRNSATNKDVLQSQEIEINE